MLRIQALTGERTFHCTAAMCAFSPVLAVLLEANEEEEQVVLLTVPSTVVLGHVVAYLRILSSGRRVLSHLGLPRPLPSHELLDFLTLGETHFLEGVRPTDLVPLVHDANYLGIQGLLELCCACIASACLRQGTFTSSP
jgi:hypothetical protein